MIEIRDKKDCCGCSACAAICPKQCITMQSDKQDFLYPFVEDSLCINCGLCEKVCPVLNVNEERTPLEIYAAKNLNEAVRMNSSSGGIFSLLAEYVIENKGVVFGAKINECFDVVHDYTEIKEDIENFRTSKYVQSKIGDSFIRVKEFLVEGRLVLFVGTPCQIGGLKKFLRKEYENLITVDFICHGVPSPGVWRKYIEKKLRPLAADGENMVLSLSLNLMPSMGINFRDKRIGWRKFGFVVQTKSVVKTDKIWSCRANNSKVLVHEVLQDNIYLRGFLQNITLRPSCFKCAFRNFRSSSDITLGDFWGIRRIHPQYDDDKGVSVFVVHRNKDFLNNLNYHKILVEHKDWNVIYNSNPSIIYDVKRPLLYDKFWEKYPTLDIIENIKRHTNYSRKALIRALRDKVLYKLGLYHYISKKISR